MQKKSKTTTIAITTDVHDNLRRMMKGREDYNEVVLRLIKNQVDVYVDFVLVDNELPQTHTIVFQLGDDKDSLYFYDGERCKPITLAETQHMMKQPKPNMTITRGDIEFLFNILAYSQKDSQIYAKLKEFLDQAKQ